MSDGLLAPLTLDQIRPMPARPSFETIVASALGALPGLDARAAGAYNALAADGHDPSDGFEGDVGAAVDDGLEAPGGATPSDAVDMVTRGDNVDTLRQSVTGLLPSPDSSAELNFDDPPQPPAPFRPDGGSKPEPPPGEVLDS